jgi:DNA-binding transcriptional MerR regulator
MATGVFIGELAKRLGVTPKTIRYYESLGLLAAPGRSESGYRVYGDEDAERLRFIVGAKALGLSLDEIKAIVAVWAHGEQPCGHVSRLLDEKLVDLDRRIRELTHFRDELRAYKARVDAIGPSPASPCRHVEGVARGQWTATPPEPEHLRHA